MKRHPVGLRLLRLDEVHMLTYLELRLLAVVDRLYFDLQAPTIWVEILCSRAVDYAIRRPNPCRMLGGASLEMSDSDPLLRDPCLQNLPGGDGLVFCPPVTFSMLTFDKSYVIAERFTIRNANKTSLLQIGQLYPESGGASGPSDT